MEAMARTIEQAMLLMAVGTPVPVSGRRGTPEINQNVTGAAYKLRVAYSRAKQPF